MKLIELLNIFRFFRKRVGGKDVPINFSESERIVRSVFSPVNLNRAGTRLLPNAFRSPPGIDEVSVNRLSYADTDFCKRHGKSIENPEAKRSFFGLALLYVKQIIATNSTIDYTPKPDNIYHSDIRIGFVSKKGQQLPPEFQKKVKELAQESQLFIDNNPSSGSWDGLPVE